MPRVTDSEPGLPMVEHRTGIAEVCGVVWFSRHGIAVTIICDNGPPFNSEDFKTFSNQWDFHHITSSPLSRTK